MPNPPACSGLGRHCQELDLKVRISDLDDDGLTLQDAASTWITGHTERITFGDPYSENRMLYVDATVHVPCRYLDANGTGSRCTAHGFRGRPPRSTQPHALRRLQLGGDRFSIVHGKRRRNLRLSLEQPRGRALPIIHEENPCATAECRTSDNRVGAACCRDLTLEIEMPERQQRTEALLRARKTPFVCRIKREDEDTVECEVISACGYLDAGDGVSCTLHGRERPNGKPAKPSICSDWPDDLDEDETGHPGCVFCSE
jgi:hypothetical protein